MPYKDKDGRTAYMKSYMCAYLKRRRIERRELAIQFLGGRCASCGTESRLQFDHIDHNLKSFDISDKIAQYSWPTILKELQKCQLLCFDCHVEKSAIEASRRQTAKYMALRQQRQSDMLKLRSREAKE